MNTPLIIIEHTTLILCIDILYILFLITALVGGIWAFIKWHKLEQDIDNDWIDIHIKDEFRGDIDTIKEGNDKLLVEMGIMKAEMKKLKEKLKDYE